MRGWAQFTKIGMWDRDGRPMVENPSSLPHSRNAQPLPVDAAHAEVFDLEELLDAVFRAFAADAAFLHAAEGRDLGRDDALVDADDAVFEAFGDGPDAADVAAVEIGGAAKFGVVGDLDRLVVGLEAVERRHRAEGLLLGVMIMSVVTSVSTVGWKKVPPSAERLPPTATLAPFLA